MIGGGLFKIFCSTLTAPHPHSSPCHPFKIPSIPGEYSFCPAQGWRINLCLSPECSFHRWLKIVMLVVLQVLCPFQMMGSFRSWGTWVLFVVQVSIESLSHIQGVPRLGMCVAAKSPNEWGAWDSPQGPRKSLEAHPQVQHCLWIGEEAEVSGFGENLSRRQPLLPSGQSLLWDGGEAGAFGTAFCEHKVWALSWLVLTPFCLHSTMYIRKEKQ